MATKHFVNAVTKATKNAELSEKYNRDWRKEYSGNLWRFQLPPNIQNANRSNSKVSER